MRALTLMLVAILAAIGVRVVNDTLMTKACTWATQDDTYYANK